MSDLKENPSKSPNKGLSDKLDVWLERAERLWPYVCDIADRAFDWKALRKADSKDIGRIMDARKRRPGR